MNAMKSVMKRSQRFPDSILRYFYSYKIIGFFSLLLLMGSFSVCEAATECESSRVDSFVKKDASVEIKNIQKNLKMVGYDLTDADIKTGVYGRKTSTALLDFCKDLEATEQKDKIDLLIDALSEIASDVEEADWRESLDDDQYKNWFSALPGNIQSNIKSVNSENEPRSFVIYTYYKNYKTESTILDINWEAEDCGCSPEVSDADRYTSYLYAFYPYSNASGEIEKINFSVLSRIGYFFVSPDDDFIISNLRHWKNESPSSAFIDLAHQYKTKVDLVVKDTRWKKWSESNTEYKIDKYVDQITSLVKEKMKGYPVNFLKPIVSFGTSPTRTMGDGVTLNFDFTSDYSFINANKSQKILAFNNMKKFIEQLKANLDADSKKKINIADKGDEYFLNVMWPVEDILNGSGSSSIYSLKKMSELSENVNLFILVMNSPRDHISDDIDKNESLTLEHLKKIRLEIDKLDVADASNLLEKILPLFVSARPDSMQASNEAKESESNDSQSNDIDDKVNEAGNADIKDADGESTIETTGEIIAEGVKVPNEEDMEQLKDYFKYSEWNYSGVGLWSLPLSENTDASLKEVFLNFNTNQDLNILEGYIYDVCSLMCPYRWVTRIGLFLLFVTVVVYAFLSIWICESKSIFGKWYFTVGLCFGILVLILTFWCDPYWKNQHDLLILFSIIIGVLTTIWLFIKKRREALLP
jgi:hypothetical protein